MGLRKICNKHKLGCKVVDGVVESAWFEFCKRKYVLWHSSLVCTVVTENRDSRSVSFRQIVFTAEGYHRWLGMAGSSYFPPLLKTQLVGLSVFWYW